MEKKKEKTTNKQTKPNTHTHKLKRKKKIQIFGIHIKGITLNICLVMNMSDLAELRTIKVCVQGKAVF